MFGISDWVVLLIALVGVAWYYFWSKMQFFKDRNILAVETVPVFGNTLWTFLQMEHIKDVLEKIYYKYSDAQYVGMYSFTTPSVVIRDIELLKQIAVKDFDHFTDHVEFADPDSDPLNGKMLFALKGEQWREMRNTLSPAFTSSKMRGMFPYMQECGEHLVQYVDKMFASRDDKGKDYTDMEMKDTFTRCTNDIIATCGFGIKINSLVDTENTFYKMSSAFINTVGSSTWENIKFGIFFFLPSIVIKMFKMEFGSKEVNTFFRNLVKSNMKEREEKNIVRHDMIHLLMLAKQGKLVDESAGGKDETREKTKLEWSDDEITAQVLVFLFAGLESTANMINLMAYELAKAPRVQRKLQQEIDSLIERSNGKLEYDGINNLKYLDMVCSESLRLWPVAVNTDRVCTKTYVLPPQSDSNKSTLTLNKGDQVWIPTMAIQRDSKYFQDPEKFDPERFSDERKGSIAPFTYFPFGLGPRQCIGTRFALMEVKILIANLLINYDLIKTPRTPDPLVLRHSIFDMVPVNGTWIGLKPRKPTVTPRATSD